MTCPSCWPVHGSSLACPGSAGNQLRCTLTGILEHHWVVLPGSNPPWRGLVYRQAPEAYLFRGIATGLEAFFGAVGCVLATALRPDPLKKALCHTRPISGKYDKYRHVVKPTNQPTKQPNKQTNKQTHFYNTLCINVCSFKMLLFYRESGFKNKFPSLSFFFSFFLYFFFFSCFINWDFVLHQWLRMASLNW